MSQTEHFDMMDFFSRQQRQDEIGLKTNELNEGGKKIKTQTRSRTICLWHNWDY